jgi:diguanylate cyclase (GGDEF)-like protein
MTGIAVPLEVAAAAWLMALALGIVAGRTMRSRRAGPTANPLSELFAHDVLENAIGTANRRMTERSAAQAVLHGRIDQMEALRTGWDPQTRAQVLDNIAAVIKAGIRRSDRFDPAEGDSFTIIIPDADEHAAKGVAERLRHALVQIRLPQMGGTNPFTASFGIAAGRTEHGAGNLVARALAALEEAQRSGTDHVVAANEIDEVILLPPPDPSAQAA